MTASTRAIRSRSSKELSYTYASPILMEQKETKKQNATTDYDIRLSLLEHYTSQAASHATGFLATAVAGFAVIELKLQPAPLALALAAVTAAFVRMMFTTFYWDQMARAIIEVPKDRGLEEAKQFRDDEEKKWVDTSLETLVLDWAARSRVKEKHSFLSQYRSMSVRSGWVLPIVIGVIVFAIDFFFWNTMFLSQR